MIVGLVAVGAVVVLWGVHRTLLWAEERDWIYYKRKPKFRGSSLGLIESIYNPEIEHVVEERTGEASRADQPESGADD